MLIKNIEETNITKYRCGSPNLCNFLEEAGIKYVYSYINKKNNRTIWVYNLTDKLSELLTQWSNNKPKRGE